MRADKGRFKFSCALLNVLGRVFPSSRNVNGRFCILNYHRVLERPDPLLESDPDVDTFRWQMELLSQCFNVIPLCEAVQTAKEGTLPPKAVCITFDDGYRSMHDLALPILKELGLPVTVFVTSGYMHEGNMWNDNIIDALRYLPRGTLDLSDIGLGTYTLGPIQDRKQVMLDLIQITKYMPPQQRESLNRRLAGLLDNGTHRRQMLTREMVVNLARSGVEIGGHTVTHPILANLDDASARKEIVENKKELEAIIGKPVRLFAYPNGKTGIDFDERHVRMVKEAGYMAAFTTTMGAAAKEHDWYQIPRGLPWDKSPLMFGLRLWCWLKMG